MCIYLIYHILPKKGRKIYVNKNGPTKLTVCWKMRAVISQHSSAVEEQTTYRIFTDSLGRVVITTTVSIQQLEAYSETLKVELYAVVK